MVLLEKGQAAEIRWLNLSLMDQKQDWYLALNPNGVVPTLLHGEQVLFESNIINEYLDAVLPQPALVPEDIHLQAEMRMWMAFELEWAKPFRQAIYETYGKRRVRDSGLDEPSLRREIAARTSNPVYQSLAIKNLLEDKNEQLLKVSVTIIKERMQWMEQELSYGRSFLLGENFSLADIALAPRLDLFELIEVQDFYSSFPNIQAYMTRIKARPSWRDSDLQPDAALNPTILKCAD